MQAFLANFTYSRRSEALFAQGKEALLKLRGEKEKHAAQLQDVRVQSELSNRMMELANESLRRSRAYQGEAAKLREELEKEKKAHADSKIQFELELAQA